MLLLHAYRHAFRPNATQQAAHFGLVPREGPAVRLFKHVSSNTASTRSHGLTCFSCVVHLAGDHHQTPPPQLVAHRIPEAANMRCAEGPTSRAKPIRGGSSHHTAITEARGFQQTGNRGGCFEAGAAYLTVTLRPNRLKLDRGARLNSEHTPPVKLQHTSQYTAWFQYSLVDT